jgi:hypothetical protein
VSKKITFSATIPQPEAVDAGELERAVLAGRAHDPSDEEELPALGVLAYL